MDSSGDDGDGRDHTRFLPNELVHMILIGGSTPDRSFLDVRWRWMAARTCHRWREIVQAAADDDDGDGAAKGSRRRGRSLPTMGQQLSLSACVEIAHRDALGGLGVSAPLLTAMANAAAGRSAEVLSALSTFHTPRLTAAHVRALGHWGRCRRCAQFGDDDESSLVTCAVARAAIRAGAVSSLDALWWRLRFGHERKLLDEAVTVDSDAIVGSILRTKTITGAMARRLWSAVGHHGSVKVANLLLDMERDTHMHANMHRNAWADARLNSRWLTHVARMNRTLMAPACHRAGEARVLLEAALVQGRPLVCDSIMALCPEFEDALGDIASSLHSALGLAPWDVAWPQCLPGIAWLLDRRTYEPISASDCVTLANTLTRIHSARHVRLFVKVVVRWPDLCTGIDVRSVSLMCARLMDSEGARGTIEALLRVPGLDATLDERIDLWEHSVYYLVRPTGWCGPHNEHAQRVSWLRRLAVGALGAPDVPGTVPFDRWLSRFVRVRPVRAPALMRFDSDWDRHDRHGARLGDISEWLREHGLVAA